jgi:xylono-1,5-lactonase
MNMGVKVIERRERDQVGEGPVWIAEERALYWVDILGKRVNRLRLDDGSTDCWSMPEMIGWLIPRREQPGFVAGFQSGFAFLELDPLRIVPIASPEPDRPGNRLNDAKADSEGAIWAGTMPVENGAPDGALYRLRADGAVARADTGYRVPNGPAISLDGRWLYHADSALGTVYRYALSGGTLAAREIFIQFEAGWGMPDGMTVDAEGGLWIAHWDGGCVSRFTADGKREQVIHLPAAQITSCTFGGENLDRMFVTSAALGKQGTLDGALFEVDPGRRGLVPLRYAG